MEEKKLKKFRVKRKKAIGYIVNNKYKEEEDEDKKYN